MQPKTRNNLRPQESNPFFHLKPSPRYNVIWAKKHSPILKTSLSFEFMPRQRGDSSVFGWDPADRAQPLCNPLRNG